MLMPKRVLDGEGFWGSRKLRRCPLWIRREYPYLYPLADCNGSFELDIPVILGKLKPNRPDLSVKKLQIIFKTFEKQGIAFIWHLPISVTRKFLHWTGSERVGRLPRLSRRSNKYEKRLAPSMPEEAYAKYLQRFGETLFVSAPDAVGNQARATARATARAKETPLGFDRFWDAYPRKVGKPAAQKAWNKILHRTDLMAGLEVWKATEQWQDEKFIPYPATFLNQRRWEDDPPARERNPESSVGRSQGAQGRTSICAECGAVTPWGWSLCGPCDKNAREKLEKKAPVNP